MKSLIALTFCAAGCLGEATFTTNDLSANVLPDLSQPAADLARVDAGDGGGYNCVELNDCEKKCASDPMPTLCVTKCREIGTPTAVTLETALQSCFGQYCPPRTDAGTAAVCTPTDAGIPTACTTCIANSQVAPANSCSGSPPECHQCYPQAAACVADK